MKKAIKNMQAFVINEKGMHRLKGGEDKKKMHQNSMNAIRNIRA